MPFGSANADAGELGVRLALSGSPGFVDGTGTARAVAGQTARPQMGLSSSSSVACEAWTRFVPVTAGTWSVVRVLSPLVSGVYGVRLDSR